MNGCLFTVTFVFAALIGSLSKGFTTLLIGFPVIVSAHIIDWSFTGKVTPRENGKEER